MCQTFESVGGSVWCEVRKLVCACTTASIQNPSQPKISMLCKYNFTRRGARERKRASNNKHIAHEHNERKHHVLAVLNWHGQARA